MCARVETGSADEARYLRQEAEDAWGLAWADSPGANLDPIPHVDVRRAAHQEEYDRWYDLHIKSGMLPNAAGKMADLIILNDHYAQVKSAPLSHNT